MEAGVGGRRRRSECRCGVRGRGTRNRKEDVNVLWREGMLMCCGERGQETKENVDAGVAALNLVCLQVRSIMVPDRRTRVPSHRSRR